MIHCGSKVGYFFENLTYFFIPEGGRKYAHTNSYNSAMTVIAQDDHLTAGAWAACVFSSKLLLKFEGLTFKNESLYRLFNNQIFFFNLTRPHKTIFVSTTFLFACEII